MYQNKVLNHMSTRLSNFFSVREMKIKYISHTKGHYGQRSLNIKFRKKACRRIQKGQKVQKHKSEKWHGNEEQTNISVYHMLQSCGVQAGSYQKTKVKNEIHIPGLKRVIQTLKSWFPFSLNWTIINAIWEIQTSRRIQHVGIYCQNSLLIKEDIVQRSMFARQSPIVAATNFGPSF